MTIMATTSSPRYLDVLSWNLNGLEDSRLGRRVEAACFWSILGAPLEVVLKNKNAGQPMPHIILFQEVVPRVFSSQIQRHLEKAGYKIAVPGSSNCLERNYFELIAFRQPLTLIDSFSEPLDKSLFGRWLHCAELLFQGEKVKVVTSHFDSGADLADIRKFQAEHVMFKMGEGLSIFGGDTNMRSSEGGAPFISDEGPGLRDVWQATDSDPTKEWTWSHEGRKSRFSRMWFSGKMKACSFQRIGIHAQDLGPALSNHPAYAQEAQARVRISDHCGLRARFQIN